MTMTIDARVEVWKQQLLELSNRNPLQKRRRADLRADLDAIYAHLYGLTRDEFAYILTTFDILRRNETRRHGEYRTDRLCLAAYDAWVEHPALSGTSKHLSNSL